MSRRAHKTSFFFSLCALAIALLSIACASSDPNSGANGSLQGTPDKKTTPSTPPTPPTSTNPTVTNDLPPHPPVNCETIRPGGGSWGSMNKTDKRTLMECNIYPAMLNLFSTYNKRYAAPGAFHCQTCHGEGAQSQNFDFSKPSVLYPLDPNNLPTENDPDPKIASAVRFMKYEVIPVMQKFLGNAKLDCFSCHAKTN